VLFEEAVSPKLDAIVSRVTTTESGLSALRVEFATMKARMNQLEAELARLTGASGQQQ
jgi:predicted  nucleic acid-binding Zn-ribbon protein